MEPITSQPTNNFGFQDENKGEGYVHGNNYLFKIYGVRIKIFKISNQLKEKYKTFFQNRFANAIKCFGGEIQTTKTKVFGM